MQKATLFYIIKIIKMEVSMIQINKVSKSYKKDNNVINEISLTINDGEIFGL